jgi:hypothetical protein
MFQRLVFLAAFAGFVSGCSNGDPNAPAKDYFLTIGGGYDVTGNQLSLERNVLFQRSVLDAKRPDKPPYEVWFADGTDPHPDVQCRDPKFEENTPLARRLLAELLGDSDAMDLVYRTNEIPKLSGPSELKQVKDRFRKLASEVKSGDRVVIYVTAHGGRAESTRSNNRRRGVGGRAANPYNTSFYFWNTEPVTASEFDSWLDRFPRDVEVVLVMVQCYAGGFAHTIFQDADAKKGLANYARCGFFAQQHDRAAAGCTPDANEADYEEYSSYFWGALAGKARDGKTAVAADYDGNGQVSFAEAHAYAIIECDTIDVPVRTSGALLKQYSELGKPSKKPAAAAAADTATADDAEYADMRGPIADLLAACHPDRRAILEQLPKKLGLGERATVEDVQEKLQEIDGKISAADAKVAAATRARRSALRSLKGEIYKTWPELRTEYAPLAVELVTDRADDFVRRIQSMPDYSEFVSAKKREQELSSASMQLEREKACCERLLQTCEEAALAANLPRVAAPEIVKRYEQLLAMEEESLASSSTALAAPK